MRFWLSNPANSTRSIPDSVEPMSPESPTTIRYGAHCFSLPQSVTNKTTFQKSKLGLVLLNTNQSSRVDLPDGTVITTEGNGELQIQRSSNAPEALADFQLFIDYLLERNPLDAFGFSTIFEPYQRLLSEAKVWGFIDFPIELPYRLWTRTRWTDLAGVYSLTKSELEYLRMLPVAIQLADGTVQGVRVLKKIDLTGTTADTGVTERINEMLPSEKLRKDVVALFEFMDCRVVLMKSWSVDKTPIIGVGGKKLPDSCEHHPRCCHHQTDKSPSTASHASTSTSPSSSSPACLTPAEQNVADQILIKLPNAQKVVAYDLYPKDTMPIPNGIDFPAFYRRGDRHVFCFNSSFALEVQELTDAASGLTKIRVGLSRVGIAPKQPKAVTSSQTSPATAAAAAAATAAATAAIQYFKAQTTSNSSPKLKKVLWQCYHPQHNAKYTSTIKWVKHLSPIRRIKFFSWGAVLVSKTMENPFAVISIVQPDLRRVYGDRISVYIRGFPSVFSATDIDVTVSANLARVYVCCCSQIASASIVPQSNKIEFDIAETPDKKFKLKLVHIDIPEGAPVGKNLGTLSCLGLLSEFDVNTGLYYQSSLCRQFCGRYNGASLTVGPTDSDTLVASDSSFGDSDEGFNSTN